MIENFTTGILVGVFPYDILYLNSHCFEVYPHCHNRTRTPFSLLILASNSSKRITCTKVIAEWSQTIRNSLRWCFHIVVSSLLRCYSLRTTRNDREFSISCIFSWCDHQGLVGDEGKRCFHLRKLFAIKLSEGVCNCLQRSCVHTEHQPRSSASFQTWLIVRNGAQGNCNPHWFPVHCFFQLIISKAVNSVESAYSFCFC